MKKHTKIYFEAFGYIESDFIPSELSGDFAVDINHIEARGSGGDPQGKKDRIENLMAVTRDEHNKYGDKKKDKFFLFLKHKEFMDQNGVKYDKEYMSDKLNKYR